MNVSKSVSTGQQNTSKQSLDKPTRQLSSPELRITPPPNKEEPESTDRSSQTDSEVGQTPLASSLGQAPDPSQWAFEHRRELQTLDTESSAVGRKRASSRLSPHLSTPSGPPPTKRLNHYRSPRKHHSSKSPRRSSQDQSGSQGPLFFSDHHSRRPALPYRMSSSEASARMLGKGHKDDTGGVKTLKLARGPAGVASPSRPSGQRTPSGSGRGTLGLSKSKSPEDRNKAGGLATLTQSGVVELLEQDDRPTFVLDLIDSALFEPGPLRVLFANAALRASPGVMDTVCGTSSLESPVLGISTVFSDFKAWMTSYVKDHESLDVALPPFSFAGALWTCSTLRKHFRVFRGTPISPRTNISSSAPSLGMPTASPMSVIGKENLVSSTKPGEGEIDFEEPQDYFGSAGSNLPTKPSAEDGNDADDVAHGLKISKLTQPSDLPVAASAHGNAKSPSSTRLVLESKAFHTSSPRGSIPLTFQNDEYGFFDWTRMADSPALPTHIQFARSIDWASTSLGPMEGWSAELRSMCNLIMASPHPAAMYWGRDLIAIYNEAYIYLAGQKHPQLMGLPYITAWGEIWDSVKDVFDIAIKTGESTMKEDDCLFIERALTDGRIEEAWFDWSIIPLVGGDGSVVGLYNPAFEKTKRKVSERRTGTLSSVGERTSTAKDLKTFWQQVILGLESNAYDVPFALLYSVSDEMDSDSQSSAHTGGNLPPAKQCTLEGKIGIPDGHPAAAPNIDLRDESGYFAQVFCEAALGDRPVILSVEKGTLDPKFLEDIQPRGHPDPCSSAICCPVQSTRSETLGYLIIGVNPRRPYDDDYNTFIHLLSRQISTAMASVVLFEEEIRAGIKAKRRADIARIELSQQLAVQTQAAVETERKFTQMARFAPVGIFIANSNGTITYRNEKWYEILKAPKNDDEDYQWMDAIKNEDKDRVLRLWSELVHNGIPMNAELRFESTWVDQNGNKGDTWVLASAYPDKDNEGNVSLIYGSITDISQQKWAEHFEKRRMEEAVELKRQQENFIDITSHEMRNPLSAILQCADEISTSLLSLKESGYPSQATKETVQNAVDAAGIISLCAQHQKRIVDDILTLSKLDSALLLVTPCDVMPRNVVQRALKMFDGEVQTADIKLNFNVDDSIEKLGIEWVKIDPSRVLQVLINLTTNAIKFTTTQDKRIINVTLAASLERPSRDGVVTYFSTRSKRQDLTKSPDWGDGEEIFLHFAVQDTGRGLTEDEKKLLFMRFSQASPRTHVQYGGSGLGLFISRELVELQGGEIGVSSKSGEGSVFAFYVKARRSVAPEGDQDDFPPIGPRKASSSQKGVPASLKSPSKALETPLSRDIALPQPPVAKDALKILVVEDNLVNQKVLARQLRNLGILVHLANHGGECLDRLKESTFWKQDDEMAVRNDPLQIDVILMDQEMPIMDGLTCTRIIREMQNTGDIVAHVPIVAVTANARSEQIDTAIEIGMDDVVSKPFRIPDLVPKVEELVAKYPAP